MKTNPSLSVTLLLVAVILLVACQSIGTPVLSGGTVEPPPLPETSSDWKMLALFPGVVTDADFNTLGYLGIKAVQSELDVEVTYEENASISMVADTVREFIAEDYNIIWAHGAQYLETMIALADHFSSVIFIAEGDGQVINPPANLWLIDRASHVGFYMIGATAALSTRTGKIAYLGGERLPFSYAEVHAVEQALRYFGLEGRVKLKAVWVEDFNDPIKARELADDLIAEGVDFIMGSLNLGIYGAFDAVKAFPDGKVLITTKYLDKSSFAPENYVTSLMYDFSVPLLFIVGRIMAGETGGYYPMEFPNSKSLQRPFMNVDARIEQRVMNLLDQVINGTLKIETDTSPIQ